MRAIWKGAVSFGLVTVPVRLYSATENHDVSFHQVRKSDGSRIRYRRVAEADGEEVAYADIGKGYRTEDGRTVVLTDEDLASLPIRSSKEIAVEKFVPAEQIDPLLYDRAYYLEPDAAAVKPYALLREALRESDRVAVVTISVRTRQSMAVLRVEGDVIVCQTLLWPDELRAADFGVLEDVPEPKASERNMATMLIESMAGDFEPEEYEDDYSRAVEELVEAKLSGGDVTEPETPADEGGEVVDLLSALEKSVARAKAARGESPSEKSEKPETSDEPEDSESSGSTGRSSRTREQTRASDGKKQAAKRSDKGSEKTSPAKKRASKKQAAAKKTATKKNSNASKDSEEGSTRRRAG